MAKKATKLRSARALISNPDNWCRNALAVDKSGKLVMPKSRTAVKFCAVGAIEKFGISRERLLRASWLLGEFSPVDFNDYNTHDSVLWMFDLAIAIQEVGA